MGSATIGSIRIGMYADSGPLAKGLKQAQARIAAFESRINATSNAVKGLFAGIAAGGATAALGGMAKQASALQEAFNKSDAIFGKQSNGVKATMESMATAFGISINEMMDSAGRLGSMFQGAGFDSSTGATYSKTITRLANDLSRFNDTSFDVAFQKIRSGLAGESEPLRDFGIFLDEETVKAKALAMGLGGLNGALDQGAKIQARAALILEKSGSAIGAAAREASGASAKIEALGGRFENLTTQMGEVVAPIFGEVMGELGLGLATLSGYFKQNEADNMAWSNSTASGLGRIGDGIGALNELIAKLATGWQALSVVWQGPSLFLQASFLAIAKAATAFYETIDKVVHAVTGLDAGLSSGMREGNDALSRSFKEFEKNAAWNKPWAGDEFRKAFTKTRDELEKMRTDLAAKPLTLPVVLKPSGAAGWDAGMKAATALGEGPFAKLVGGLNSALGAVGPKVAAAIGAPKKADDAPPLGAATQYRSALATSIAYRNRYREDGKEVDKAAKKTAENTSKLLDVEKTIADGIRTIADGIGMQIPKFRGL